MSGGSCGVLEVSVADPAWAMHLPSPREARLAPLADLVRALRAQAGAAADSVLRRADGMRWMPISTAADGDELVVDVLACDARGERVWIWARACDESAFFDAERDYGEYLRFRAAPQVMRGAGCAIWYAFAQANPMHAESKRLRAATEWLLRSDEAAPRRTLPCGLAVRCGVVNPFAAYMEDSRRRAPAPNAELAAILDEVAALERAVAR